MGFTRTSQDANTHNTNACCGASNPFAGDDVPDPEKQGDTVYCYTRCSTCGALWRDGFRDGHHTEYEYTGRGEPDFDWGTLDDWEFGHIDDNKLHDGRAIAVYTPSGECVDLWVDRGYDNINFDNYEKHETYVYRFSEVDPATVSPVCIGADYDYHPDPDVDGPGVAVTVTGLEFTDEYILDGVTVTINETGDYVGDTDLDTGDTRTFTADEFARMCDLLNDPYTESISRRPAVPKSEPSPST